MTATQRWITVVFVGLILALGVVFALVGTHSRIGSLPPNVPPLPCGHAALTSTQYGSMIKVVCTRGEVWFYGRGSWTQTSPVEQALPGLPPK